MWDGKVGKQLKFSSSIQKTNYNPLRAGSHFHLSIALYTLLPGSDGFGNQFGGHGGGNTWVNGGDVDCSDLAADVFDEWGSGFDPLGVDVCGLGEWRVDYGDFAANAGDSGFDHDDLGWVSDGKVGKTGTCIGLGRDGLPRGRFGLVVFSIALGETDGGLVYELWSV